MNTRVLFRLMWKDARSVRPLIITIPGMIMAFYALLVILDASMRLEDARMGLAVTILWSVPLLVAFASPAMLVGGEDESGSLAWLQTLPTNWKQISLSKLLVTLLSTTAAWLLGLVVFVAYCSGVGYLDDLYATPSQSVWDPLWIMLLIGFGISIWVLLSSFCTSYLFRSPITALLLVLPAMFGLMVASSLLMEWTLGLSRRLTWEYLDVGTFAILAAIFGGLTLLLFVSYFITAWWRLSNQTPTLLRNRLPEFNENAYRPPLPAVGERMVLAISGDRPSQWYALLWSQLRPIRVSGPALILLGCLTTWLALTAGNGFEILSASVAGLVFFVLGSLTFYGDSVKQRCRFFADRGISPTQIWATRVVPIAVALSTMFVVGILVRASEQSFLVENFSDSDVASMPLNIFAIATAVFALTQLVSQWSPRPALTFFAAPPFTYFCSIALFIVLYYYTGAIPILFISAAILFFASWRLTPLWLAGEKGKPYVLPFFGYTAAAIFVPIILIFVARWITMPSVDRQWRERMMTMELPSGDSADETFVLPPRNLGSVTTAMTFQSGDTETLNESLASELADPNSLGEKIAFGDLVYRMENARAVWAIAALPGSREEDPADWKAKLQRHLDMAKLLTRWSKTVRGEVIGGRLNFSSLVGIAERADQAVIAYLDQRIRSEGMSDEVIDLIGQLPNQETVNAARRASLIRDWRRLQKDETNGMGRLGIAFQNPPTGWWQYVERKRADRFLDALLRELLDHFANDVTYLKEESLDRIRHLEKEAYLSLDSKPALSRDLYSISEWLQRSVVLDQSIKNLRERVTTK